MRSRNRIHTLAGDYLGSPVINATGIEGAWDFDLHWDHRAQILPAGVARTTIFDAVDKQLGLLLMPSTAPAPVLVVDRVNQNPSPNPPDTARKLPPRVVEYEVADLKINKEGNAESGFNITPDGGVDLRNQSLKTLMAAAWDMDMYYADKGFANLPKWTSEIRVDIHARPPRYANAPSSGRGTLQDDDVRLMLRNLLIERFQIRTHVENRLLNAYTLFAKNPRMKKADPANRAGCREARTIRNDPRDANPLISRLVSCQNVTMAQFAAALHMFADDYIFNYEVEDATGLAGAYDFTLSFSHEETINHPAPGQGPDPIGGLSLPEAISRQLGLKLEMRKRLLPIGVIDHMEETPLEN